MIKYFQKEKVVGWNIELTVIVNSPLQYDNAQIKIFDIAAIRFV